MRKNNFPPLNTDYDSNKKECLIKKNYLNKPAID